MRFTVKCYGNSVFAVSKRLFCSSDEIAVLLMDVVVTSPVKVNDNRAEKRVRKWRTQICFPHRRSGLPPTRQKFALGDLFFS